MATDRNVITKAVADSATPCMRAAGIDYRGSPDATAEVYQDTNRLTVKRAQQYGYRPFDFYGEPIPQQKSGDGSKKGELRPDPLFALYAVKDPGKIPRISTSLGTGIPYPDSGQGCVGKVIRSVISKRDFTLVHSADDELGAANFRTHFRVIADPGYKAAEKAWARCLTEAGYPATTLEANDRRISAVLRKSVAEQVERAVPDARCRERHLYPVNDSLYQKFEDEELAKAEGTVTAWIEVRERVLRKAARAVAAGPGG